MTGAQLIDIRQDDLTGAPTRHLLACHSARMHDISPPGAAFVLDLSGLQVPDITLWSVWQGASLLGIAALKGLPERRGEVKSMRTHPDHLRKGVARALLDHIIGQARARGMQRLSLETGRGPHFEPALALYQSRGFAAGEAFADYRPGSEFNAFYHLDLS